MSQRFLKNIEQYYSEKIERYGPVAQGVDWKDQDSHQLRHFQMARILPPSSFEICDVGCGYGDFYTFLKNSYTDFTFTGVDLSREMIRHAQDKFKNDPVPQFNLVQNNLEIPQCQFLTANGLFNLKFEHNTTDWLTFVYQSMEDFFDKANETMAISFLSSYNDPEFRRDDLFYADPCLVYDFAMKNLSRSSAILSDYPLFEFVLVVKK